MTAPLRFDEHGASRRRVRALIIGIDRYLSERIPSLRGCENDAHAFSAFLHERLHIDDGDVEELLSSNLDPARQPTRENIVGALLRLSERTQPGDGVIVFYSGHGSRSEGRGQASVETLVPMDRGIGNVFDIRDSELNILLQGITRTTNDVTLILDSCHGSGATRDLDADLFALESADDVRQAPPDERPRPPVDPRIAELEAALLASTDDRTLPVPGEEPLSADAVVRALLPEGEDGWALNPENRYVLVAACQTNQRAVERALAPDGSYYGLLTWHLLEVLRSHRWGVGVRWEEVFARVRDRVSAASPDQRPVLQGNPKRQVLGGEWAPRDPGFGVTSNGDRLVLEAGAVSGITAGTLVALYPTGLLEFPDDLAIDQRERLGVAEVVRADGLSASARLIARPDRRPNGTADDLPEYCRGRIVVPPPVARLPVRVTVGDADVEQIVMASPFLVGGADPVVEVRSTGLAARQWGLVRTDDDRLLAEVPAEPNAILLLRRILERYARYWSTLTRRATSERIPSNDTLAVRLLNANTGAEIPRADDGTYRLPSETELLIQITNERRWPLYAVVVDCTDSSMVELLYPYSEEAPIEPSEARVVGSGWSSREAPTQAVRSPLVRPFLTSLADGVDEGWERLRVFGTTAKPLDARDVLELAPNLAGFVEAALARPWPAGALAPEPAPPSQLAPEGDPADEDTSDMWTVTDVPMLITRRRRAGT